MTALTNEPLAPTSQDVTIAREFSRKLATLADAASGTVHVHIVTADMAESLDLPLSALHLLARILAEMSKGNAITLTPVHAQLTTQQAADLLGVSRPFIVKEIRDGRIPCLTVGTHRRIAYRDLLAYRRKYQEAHNQAMDELVAQAQEHDMGY